MLRQGSIDIDGSFLQVYVTSGGNWSVAVRHGSDSIPIQIAGGQTEALNMDDGDSNHLVVVLLGDRGWFFINGTFVGAFNGIGVAHAGDVSLITGASKGNEVDGLSTQYRGFAGFSIHQAYGPASGTIENLDNFVGVHRSGLQTLDFVAEAEFITPGLYSWDYGFAFRHPEANALDVLAVSDSIFGGGHWSHRTRWAGSSEYTEVDSGSLSNWKSGTLTENRLLLIAFGPTGWFFVNDRFVATLDLRRNLRPGDISAMAGFFNNSTHDVDFRDFTVWAP